MFRKLALTNIAIAALALLLAACGGGGVNTVPVAKSTGGGLTTSFALIGLVANQGTIGLAQLNALTQQSVVTNPQAGTGTLGQHTYTGPLLYDVLESAVPNANPAIKNDLLRRGIVIAGSDGYRAAVAWGEIDPKFAGKKIILATLVDGAPITSDGFTRLIVPGDVFAGRYVSNVASVTLEDSIAPQPAATFVPTTSFQLTGLINTPGTYDINKLNSLPQSQVSVTSGGITSVYGGVLVTDMLNSAVLALNPSIKNDQLTKSVIAIGSDGYTSIVTAGEVDPKFGNVKVLVATSLNGAPLGPTQGFARIVVPGDAAAGRYVSGLKTIAIGQL
jgi:DMSO/TMAO reductase YedYZ molybdopterin-dependent catalytic subunit